MMKKALGTIGLACALTACSQPQKAAENNVMLGGQKDTHGCLAAAGQTYSFLKKECVQVFNVAEIKFADPNNKTLAVYGILSEDKTQVEIFGTDLPENTILSAVKGGYASQDGKVRLIKTKKSWKIRK